MRIHKPNYTPKDKVVLKCKESGMLLPDVRSGRPSYFDMIDNDTCPTEYFKGDICYNINTKQMVFSMETCWTPMAQVEYDEPPKLVEEGFTARFEYILLFTDLKMIQLPIHEIRIKKRGRRPKPPKGLNYIKIVPSKKELPKKPLNVKVKLNIEENK